MSSPEDAVEFLRECIDAESNNRQRGLDALKFRFGDQWPQYAINSRGLDRPQLTINETNTYIKKICNMQRQQRPRGKAQPVDDRADKKIAKIITGLGRHIEVNSDADHAYDNAFEFAATIGRGYWRLRTDYISDDSFYQDIYIDTIKNPFTVYFDPHSELPDGSDAIKALITDVMPREAFKQQFKGAQDHGFDARGGGDSDPVWFTEKDIRIAEYMYVERKASKLVMLTDGSLVWGDEIPKIQRLLQMAGIGIKGERDSFKRVVKWCKQTGSEILEEKALPGRYIPVVPVYWTDVIIDSERRIQGLVEDAKDPARMINFWQTSITESIALAPKAKWLMAEGQDEGHENEFKNANLSAVPVLRFKQTDVEGRPAAPPQRIQPEPPPSGMIEAAFLANQNLSRVMGVYDPAVRGGAQHKSDKTLNAEAGQSELTNFDGYDNLTRSIKHTWRIMLDYIPVVYDTERVQRIIGDDGKDDLVTLNQRGQKQDDDGQAIETVLNDVTVGTYDVVMETGPGYDTRRQEGVAATMQLMATPVGEKVAQFADDLIVRQMDFYGADAIADRLQAANPLAQIDEKDDVPPKVQMMIKSLQANLQQAGQKIQQMEMERKYRVDVEGMKQEAETKRELMRTTAKSHDSELWAREEARQVDSVERTRMHDTEVRALSAQNVEEIRGLVKLLVEKIGTAEFNKEVEEEEQELMEKSNEIPANPVPMQ